MMPLRDFFLISALLALANASTAQANDSCPLAASITTEHFLGTWSITLAAAPGQKPERSLLQLHPHPIYRDSLKGELQRGARTLQVVADWDEDTLTFEESQDGQHISATWQAHLVQGQCARAFEGVRFVGDTPDTAARRFRMRSERTR